MIDAHVAHAAWYVALALFGALVAGPFWMTYALRRDAERREWEARRRARSGRR